MSVRTSRAAVGLLVIAMLAGCGDDTPAPTASGLVGAEAEVHLYDGWTTPTDGSTAEVSLRVHNGGPQTDRLLEATCACEGTVEIDGALVVDPEEEVVLTPGGTPGLRLTSLTEPLRRGRFVTLTLVFERAGATTGEIEVRAPEGP